MSLRFLKRCAIDGEAKVDRDNESRGLAMHYVINESALFSLWRMQHDLESIVSEESKAIRALERPEAW